MWRSYGQNRESIVNIFLFFSTLLISNFPNISNKTYNDTGENQLSAEHIGGMVSITICQIILQLKLRMGNPLVIIFYLFYECYVFLMFQTSDIMAQEKINDPQNKKISAGECCLVEHYVSSWSRYVLKREYLGIFVFYLFCNIMSSVVVSSHGSATT